MSEEFDQAKEQLEETIEDRGNRKHARTAIIIAIMAACLALTEFAEKDAQASYLSSQIVVSNIWAQYQGKSVRRAVYSSEAELLGNSPTASDPAVQQKIAQARANAARMLSEPGADGMTQLMQRARAHERLRDEEMHRKNMVEIASGGLQIAIVLASISVVVNLPIFMMGSLLLAVTSGICGLIGELSLL